MSCAGFSEYRIVFYCLCVVCFIVGLSADYRMYSY